MTLFGTLLINKNMKMTFIILGFFLVLFCSLTTTAQIKLTDSDKSQIISIILKK
jgi:hypothetical protein